MNEDNLNLEIRKFLKKVGISSQRVLENHIKESINTGSIKIGETDIFGRPYQFDNVHIVDSSIFPSIPAGPITLTVMANSLRIADNFDKIK